MPVVRRDDGTVTLKMEIKEQLPSLPPPMTIEDTAYSIVEEADEVTIEYGYGWDTSVEAKVKRKALYKPVPLPLDASI